MKAHTDTVNPFDCKTNQQKPDTLLCVSMYQVYLWPAEAQASYPGDPPAAVPEVS